MRPKESVTKPKEKTWLTAKIFTASSRSCAPIRHPYERALSLPRAVSSLTAVLRHVYRRAAVSLPSRRGKFTAVPR